MHKIIKLHKVNVSKIIVIECFGGVASPVKDNSDCKLLTIIKKNIGHVLAVSDVDREFLFTKELKALITSFKRYSGEQVNDELFIYVSKS